MCQHDPTYQRDNEANGGQGCPICNREHVERLSAIRHINVRCVIVPAPLTDTEYAAMSEGLPDGIIEEYSSATEGHW